MGTTTNEDGTFTSPFPESDRLRFKTNAIHLVMCQLTFPTILRIANEAPAVFQEPLRKWYPLFRTREATRLPEQFQLLQPTLPPEYQVRLYDFGSEDGHWTVTLAQDFITLQTTDYTSWEDFRMRLSNVLEILVREYDPIFYTRIGLRYQDLFDRRSLGLEEKPWSALFNPALAGELTDDLVSTNIQEKFSRLLIRLNDLDGHVMINHGLEISTNEHRYFIDSDFYKEAHTSIAEAKPALDRLKRHAGRMFRWCIQEPLKQAMGPTAIEPDSISRP